MKLDAIQLIRSTNKWSQSSSVMFLSSHFATYISLATKAIIVAAGHFDNLSRVLHAFEELSLISR